MTENQNFWIANDTDTTSIAIDGNSRHLKISLNAQDAGNMLRAPGPDGERARQLVSDAFLKLSQLKGSYRTVNALVQDNALVRALTESFPTGNSDPEVTLVIVAPDEVRDASELTDATASVILPITLLPGRLILGPDIGKYAELSLEDRVNRRILTCPDPETERALWSADVRFNEPTAEEIRHLLAVALREIEKDHPGYAAIRTNTLELDTSSRTLRWRPIHAMPHRNVARSRRDASSIIDDYQGIVLRTRLIDHHESFPSRIHTVQADVARTDRIYPWPNNVTCQGSAFDNIESARLASIGESVERYCGNLLNTLPTLTGSFDELSDSGLKAVDPKTVVLHSDEQYKAKGFPLVRFSSDLVTQWVPGRDLQSNGQVWIPKALTYVNYHTGPNPAPFTNISSYPGISAGISSEMAQLNALEEIIERHATMVWWHNEVILPRLTFPDDFRAVWEEGMGRENKVSGISLPNPLGIPVMAAIVENTEHNLVTIGFATRANPREAFLKALTEAFTLQEGCRDLLVEDSNMKAAMQRGEIDSALMKDWRRDRKYLDSFREDFRDVSDLLAQLQVYLDPRAVDRIRHIISGTESVNIDSIPDMVNRTVEFYVDSLDRLGFKTFAADITSGDVASAGLQVWRVLVPGLIHNFPAAFPTLGDQALQKAAIQLGMRDDLVPDSELNYMPLPHA